MSERARHTDRERAIALAGLLQATGLVRQTGRGQHRDELDTRTCIASIFVTDPPDAAAVYGNVAALRNGLELLVSQLDNRSAARDIELTAHTITLLHLERKLSRNRTMLDTLADGIAALGNPPDLLDDTVIDALAGLYQSTISTLTPRVMVRGEPAILTSPEAQRMIRALLLAGIRAAVLWRQCNGNRLRLIIGRRGLLDAARALLREPPART